MRIHSLGGVYESGVYEIRNSVTGKRYIGSAVRLSNRERQHCGCLARGAHCNRLLQRSWNKHGPAAFTFAPLLVCAKEDLLLYEQRCLDALRPEYNLTPLAASNRGFKFSPEAGALQSAGLRDAAVLAAAGQRDAAALRVEGQRNINLIWETTQMRVALSVIWCSLVAAAVLAVFGRWLGAKELQLAAVVFVFGASNLVIGFYFGRTNHARTGGIGDQGPEGR